MQRAPVVSETWASVDCARLGGRFEHLREMLESHRADPSIRVVVLSRPELWPIEGAPDAGELLWLERFELPTIAVIEGEIAGPGLDVALACDIRVCSSSASFRADFRSRRLMVLVGAASAVTILQRRGRLDAAMALDLGVVSQVSAPKRLDAEVSAVAETIASRGPLATRLAKEAVWRGLAMPLEQALRFETDLTLLLQTTKDRAEGVRAFLEKRPPRFNGE